MMQHREIIQLAIAYTLAGAFIFTVIATCLTLVGWVKFADKRQQNKLFHALLLELVVGSVGFFFDFIKVNPQSVERIVSDRAQVEALKSVAQPSPSSMKFNSNNLADVNTWAVLKILDQIKTDFNESATLTMSHLGFWNTNDSSAQRRLAAAALAAEIDAVFSQSIRANYESGVTKRIAIGAIAKVLENPTSTVGDLAIIVDQSYRFAPQ